MTQILKGYLEHICGRENVAQNVLLATKTTFKIGGAAKFFVTVKKKETLIKLINSLTYVGESFYIIGNGSNILAPDKGFDGVVVKCAFVDIVQNGNFVYADAGVSMGKLCTHVQKRGLSGLEWACAIPATVGGAVYMNAGAHGSDISKTCVCVDVLVDGKVQTITADKLKFAYRTSIFVKRKNWVIIGAYFYLSHDEPKKILERENQIRLKRKSLPTQPSAGSTFKRPHPEFYVGTTIEQLGLKGTQIGGAQVSPQHAGIIVNTGNATMSDVVELIQLIRKKVFESHGVKLQLEYQLMGSRL